MTNKLKNFGMFTESDYTNRTLEECSKIAETNGYSTRVIEKDGDSFILTMDFRSDRINLRLRRNIVIGAHVG